MHAAMGFYVNYYTRACLYAMAAAELSVIKNRYYQGESQINLGIMKFLTCAIKRRLYLCFI
jgi:hypothetical protein